MQLLQVRLDNNVQEGMLRYYYNYEFAYYSQEAYDETIYINLPPTDRKPVQRNNYRIYNHEYTVIGDIKWN